MRTSSLLRRVRILAWVGAGLCTLAAGLVISGVRLPWLEPLIENPPFAVAIGGPFTLVDQDGQRYSSTALAGHPYAIFFGYTHCPDVCPTTLLEMTNHLDSLGPAGDRLKVLFITIDPERDTAEFLKAYLASFDHRIVGLTGTPAEIAEVARAYRAVYERMPGSDGNYTMNHTASVLLFDAAGKFAGTLAFQEKPEHQLAKLRRLVEGAPAPSR